MDEKIIKNRYEFILLFDVQDGNPNGDPDAGNLPRVDAETGLGLVTDVCLKRKVRNYVQIIKEQDKSNERKYDIYVKEKAVLGRAHVEAFHDLKIELGEGATINIPDNLKEDFEDYNLPDGLSIIDDEDTLVLVVAADADKKQIKEYLKESKPSKELKKFIDDSIKNVKSRKPTADETEKGRDWMCKNFYDIRTFGAVLSLKSAPNCGQVRGPIQLTFARSIDPVVALEHCITRMAVATEAEAEKQGGDNRTMGRKYTIPYGLYKAHGFVSSHLAAQTGFDKDDLELLWEAIENMFDHDHSAARGLMATRNLIIFKHELPLGNASANKLFDLVTVEKTDKDKPTRSYNDYTVTIDKSNLPKGVTIDDASVLTGVTIIEKL
ncbi:MAG: type I-C CRISPR-associated protein Cas7/Csd2 [Candidatus Margulisiibacteriota bacterium]|nr:MAG: type I-C CRISPR-associated protein Cas7/Csd2 [Candidatus Margulisbacteria bacterium GWD2_39_127]PZM83689.1 MAG: type I-C CRISPR-associated protein Cas7/Csd2 [Candidatus Margulisiibacteriota bacterium]HAR64191.1 type I-C CRISPR-associated protein Cas7/Csd2 [Candidatus Margulisiibacteriota bacterium]HCY36068.1 type I-C CRISPR-associated protein Cas7/Csd2 [Candidatus Margulisiibacteriota bacterium]